MACSDEHPESEPEGYMPWFVWANQRHDDGYTQRRCTECRLYRVWVPPEVT